MSEEISVVPSYDPANPYSVLAPNAEPFVVEGGVALVPSYDLMISNDPAVEALPPEVRKPVKESFLGQKVKEFFRGPSADQKAQKAEEQAEQEFLAKRAKEELPPPKPKEPAVKKKRFFDY